MRRFLFVFTALFAGAVTAIGQVGSSGMPLLKLAVTGRAVAMGYTSALEDGPSAVQGNPAGIELPGAGRAAMLHFTHQEWIQDTRTEFLGVNIARYQLIAFIFAAALAGLAGAIWATPLQAQLS